MMSTDSVEPEALVLTRGEGTKGSQSRSRPQDRAGHLTRPLAAGIPYQRIDTLLWQLLWSYPCLPQTYPRSQHLLQE